MKNEKKQARRESNKEKRRTTKGKEHMPDGQRSGTQSKIGKTNARANCEEISGKIAAIASATTLKWVDTEENRKEARGYKRDKNERKPSYGKEREQRDMQRRWEHASKAK